MKKMRGLLLLVSMFFLMGLVACGDKTKKVENQIPESYEGSILVTINPKIRLFLDEDQRINGVEYLNEDAKKAFSEMDFSGLTLEKCMEKIVDAAVEKKYLTDGKEIQIAVDEVKDSQWDGEAVCAKMKDITEEILADRGVEANVSYVEREVSEASGENTTTTAVTKEPTSEPVAPTTAAATEPVAPTTPPTAAANKCSVCVGSGKCDECKGDGYRGLGFTVSCPRCHGSLTETCSYCDENGNSLKHEGTCDFPNCMGTHVFSCKVCNGGSTPVTCASCNGSGKCKGCGGTGTR